MAGNRKFHNKFHSANHHTLPSPHIKDSGLDPIASHQFPFIGDYVVNGLLSASNNYLLNSGGVRSTHLDTIRHGLPAPDGWNILRDSTYIDGDVTITGNLTAYGELTYLHTQVHTASATEIEVFANNSNGKTVGLLVDQHGTNDIVHIKNDGRSALFMTGSGHNPGWIGINLAESPTGEEKPNQRLTIVGSVSVVPDSNELADQTFQADAGTSGSLYIEGGLHVNDNTFLDQVTVDTTDGKFHISGSGNDGFENIFEVDVPAHLDRTHIDTTDGDFVVSGSNWMDIETPADFNAHVNLDRTHIDTTDGDLVVSGSNWMDVDTPTDFDSHVNLDRTHIDTTDGDFVVSGSGNMDIDAPVDFDSHVRLDQVTVDTKDGKFLIETSGADNNSNIFDVDVHTHLDQVTVNTSDGQFYVGGPYPLNVDTHSLLDQVTVDTNDGKFLITTTGSHNIFEVDVHSHLDQVTVDTTDGRFLISGEGSSGYENIFEVDVPTHLDKTVIDTADGDFTISGNNDMIVNVDADFTGHTKLDQITVNTTPGKFFIDGSNNLEIKSNTIFNNGSTIFEDGGVEIQTTPGKDAEINGSGVFRLNTESYFNNHAQFKKVTIDTNNGVFTVNGQQKTIINTPTLLSTLTADSSDDTIYFKGTNKTIFDTDVDINGHLIINSQVDFTGNVTLSSDSVLDVDGITRLDQTTIDTTDGDFTAVGSGIVDIYTPVRISNDVHITGDLRVDGNAYLSAGPAGVINVGDQNTDNVIFHADVNSDITPNLSNFYTLGTSDKKWLNVHGLSGDFEHLYVDKKALVEGDLDVNGKTTLDETAINTADGSFVVSASDTLETQKHNKTHVHTDLTTYNQVSAIGGPWRFGGFDRPYFEEPGQVNYENIRNWETGNVLNHPFWVQERSLFSQGLTAFGPVQIGELPDGVVDELSEPTFEVLGNVHIREGNLKIVSDIRHLEDENTLIRFSPDKLEFKVGDVNMLTLTEKLSANGHDIVEVGGVDQPVDLKLWKSDDNTPGLYYDGITGEVEITGTVGIGGKNTAKDTIGDGLDIHGSARVTETLSARNLVVDYITVNNNSFGNIGGGMGTTSTGVLTTLSGVAVSGHETSEWVNGTTQTYLGTETGIVIDVTDDQGDIQKLYSFTFEALSANEDLGIEVGDVQSTTYQLAAKYDNYYTQAVVNDVEYGITHTSDSPIAFVTSVVLSAHDVPTDERIVKIIIQPEVDCNFYTHNKLIPKEIPQRVDTMTTGDFDVHGDLTLRGDLSATGGMTIDEDIHVKGDLRVDGNAYLSAGASGMINVGDSESDVVIFHADVHSDIIPDHNIDHDLGSKDQQWRQLYVQDVSATGDLTVDGNTTLNSTTLNTLTANNNTVLIGPTTIQSAARLYNTLTVDGNTTLSGTVTVQDDVYIKGNLRVDGNAWLSAGASGQINVGDNENDVVIFHADVHSDIIPDHNVDHDLGTKTQQWRQLYVQDISATGTVSWSGGDSILANAVYSNVAATSAKRDSVYTSVNDTSAEWDSVYTSVNDTSAEWDAVYSNVAATSAKRDSVYTSVSETSAEWDAVYSNVAATSAKRDSVYTSVSETSAEWDSVYSWVNSDSGTNNTDYNQTHYVNASGDKIDGNLHITGDLRVDGHAFLSAGSDGVIHVGDSNEDKVTFAADINSSFIPDQHQQYDLGHIGSEWNVLHVKDVWASQHVIWNGGNSDNSNSVYNYIQSTSGDEGFATLSAYRDDRFVLRHDQVPNLAITQVYRVAAAGDVNDLEPVQNYDIYRGDIILVESNEDNLIATEDHPPGNYNMNTGEYQGYEKLFAPGNMVRFINGKQGPSVTFTTDDFDDSDTVHKFVLSGDIVRWDSNYTSVTDTSANWNTAYTDSQANNLDIANVMSTSANWDTAYTKANANEADLANIMPVSGNWNTAYTDSQANNLDIANVMSTSANWNTSYTDSQANNLDIANVMSTSANWNTSYTDSQANNLDIANVMSTSANWDKTHTSVTETSGEWDSVYSWVNSDSGTNNTDYNQTHFVNASGDTMTGHLEGTTAYFTSLTALSSVINVIDIKVRELSGFDIIDGDLDVGGKITWTGGSSVYANTAYTDSQANKLDLANIMPVSGNWNTAYTDSQANNLDIASIMPVSGNWNTAYTDSQANNLDLAGIMVLSGNWNTAYTDSQANNLDIANVMSTSANWNSVYTSSSETSANWDSVYTSSSDTSAEWDSVYTSSSETSANWDTAYTDSQANNAVRAVSANWNSVYTSSSETSGEWDSVYTFINTTSATEGYATLVNGKLDESQVPNLSITDVHVVTYNSDVSAMCNPNDATYQEIERGDVVVITSLSGHNLIATTDTPTGIYNPFDDTFEDFQKLVFPQDYVKSVNGKQGLNGNVILNPDDLDDLNTAHKFVTATQRLNWDSNYTSTSETSAEWDSVYSWVNSDSATNNTDYNQTHFVNASGDKIDGNLHITGDLRVDGNAYLSAGTSGIINVGDDAEDLVVFHADVDSNVTPQTDVTHNLGNIDQQWQTLYVQDISASRDVNVNGFTQLDKTHVDTTEGDFVVSGSNQVTLTVPLSVDNDVHITGDLRVDGNAYLSAGGSGVINVGDTNTDNVVFHADVNSTVIPNITDTYSLGTPDQRWSILHTASAEVDDFKVKNLTVTETTILSGKSDQGPGVIIEGTPTGIFDVGTRGFEDREGDYMIPDVDITGDVVLHGSMSADEAYIYSLTASNFKAEYQRLVVNDGDLELWNGNLRQRGGVLLIESDIGHIDDENTYIRFQPDQIQMVCHDVNMIQFNEYPTADDIIILGDTHDAVDIKVQNPADNNTLYIDGDTARIGISTDSPQEKFHIYNGQAQFATGDEDGAVMITAGATEERVDKRGSIRWNTDLNRYEGYLIHNDTWGSLNSIGDTDGDTYIDIDAESEHYPDSDRLALYTAGCSAMTIHPNQTVVFAGDIQFDNITIYDNNSVTGPLTATSEFIYLKVNGKDRAIRLWETPKDTREDLETFHGDSIVHIGDPCGLGHLGQIPTQTISAQNVLFSPPTQ